MGKPLENSIETGVILLLVRYPTEAVIGWQAKSEDFAWKMFFAVSVISFSISRD